VTPGSDAQAVVTWDSVGNPAGTMYELYRDTLDGRPMWAT